MTPTSDPVARTRGQLLHAIRLAEVELIHAHLTRDDEATAEVERELRYLRNQLASLNECFS